MSDAPDRILVDWLIDGPDRSLIVGKRLGLDNHRRSAPRRRGGGDERNRPGPAPRGPR